MGCGTAHERDFISFPFKEEKVLKSSTCFIKSLAIIEKLNRN
jgi:hypothetical protein